MKKDPLIVLLNNTNSENVKYIQKKLESRNIYSVHISSGYRIPKPVGLRVKLNDYESACKLLKSWNIEPYMISSIERRSALRQFITLLSVGSIVIILLVMMILGVFNI